MTAHLNFMATNMARNNPMVMASLEKNIFEHISLMAQEQIELEFREELPNCSYNKCSKNPNDGTKSTSNNKLCSLTQQIEARKAVLIAEMMEEFMEEEKKITSQFDNDPIAKLRSRELDLRAQENQRKEREGQQRMDLDKMRAMMNQENQDEKLEQNEELAKLRADTSIEKTILGKTLPSSDQMVPNIDIVEKK